MSAEQVTVTQPSIERMDTGEETSSTVVSQDNSASVDTAIADSASESSTNTIVPSENVEMTDTLCLRFSLTCKPFKLPEYPEVAQVASEYFEDPFLNCIPYREGSEKVYKFELNNPVQKHGHSLTFAVEGKRYNVDLKPYEKRSKFRYSSNRSTNTYEDRENNLLLTFYGAGSRDYNNITMEQFDKLVQNDLGFVLEKPTMKQKIRYTNIFNGNRYCVIRKPENLASIPNFVPVQDPVTKKVHHIPINYNGQLFTCGRCGNQHGRRCPMLEDFYAAKERRQLMEANKEIKTKIISDSTLRNADQLGLRADIMAMPGGGLGQIVQAAMDDPDTKDKSHIVLLGGTNDINNNTFEDEPEFIENIKGTITKILELANSEPGKMITLVNTQPKDKEELYASKEEKIQKITRARYLNRKLREETTNMPNLDVPVNNVNFMAVEYDIDETGHPTIEGTTDIIKQMNEAIKLQEELIWNMDFITSERKYRGVQPIFRYGCNHCSGYGQSIQQTRYGNGNLCDDCFDLVKFNKHVEGCSLFKTIQEEVTKEFDDPPITKRLISDDEEESEPQQKIACTDSTRESRSPPNNDDGITDVPMLEA